MIRMRETDMQIQVQNSAIITAITPLTAIFPITWINVGRNVSFPARHWVEGGIAVFFLLLFVFGLRAGMKKISLVLQTDGLHFLKRHVALDQIELLSYNQRTRYLRVKTRPAMRGFNVYLGNKEEAPGKIAVLENWVQQTGVKYEGSS
jgi:hypothetical protein